MNKKKSLTLFSILGLLIAVSSVLVFLTRQFIFTGATGDARDVIFEVTPGQGMIAISELLEGKKLVKNAWLFSQYTRITGQSSKLKRGEYLLRGTMTPNEIIEVITSGKSLARNLTFAEGLNIFDIADILEKASFGTRQENLNLMFDKEFIKSLLGEELPSLEGYLFPETYQVTKFDTSKEVIEQMVNRFLIVWKDIEPLAQKAGWNRHQTVTFASLVEKETGAKSDRPLVASVFHNRLKKKMKLQTDPTILYGMALITRLMPTNITRNDLSNPTPYNTYTIYGLPPGAISNPGRDAFQATFNPAQTNYIYFVSRNDGTTHFSENLKDHNQAVQNYQINPKAREGKSWRDLVPKEKTN